jgi:putative exosortase-associated protein (TIGR04073 family)
MMRRQSCVSKVLAAVVFATMFLLVSEGWARQGPYYETSLMARMTRKFMRGCGNVVFGWCEIPRNIHIAIEDLDPLTGTLVGTVKGAGHAVVRTSWGFWEVFTFPIPVPSEYRNVVKPEFVWQDLFE